MSATRGTHSQDVRIDLAIKIIDQILITNNIPSWCEDINLPDIHCFLGLCFCLHQLLYFHNRTDLLVWRESDGEAAAAAPSYTCVTSIVSPPDGSPEIINSKNDRKTSG